MSKQLLKEALVLWMKYYLILNSNQYVKSSSFAKSIGLTQCNLLKGIVIWLVSAQSVVQSPVRSLDSNFSNAFSLFQLLQVMLAIYRLYRLPIRILGGKLQF